MKDRIKNIAVWVYVVANVILVTVTTLSFVAGNEVVAYIAIGAEVIVNIFTSLNNPDFKGMIKDKKFIVKDAKKIAQIIDSVYKETKDIGDE